MAEENKTVELTEEDLQKVSGGDTIAHKTEANDKLVGNNGFCIKCTNSPGLAFKYTTWDVGTGQFDLYCCEGCGTYYRHYHIGNFWTLHE